MTLEIHEILRSPHITEKSSLAGEGGEGAVVVFKVRKEANKHQIKKAVETLFEVKVAQVRTVNYRGKVKRQGRFSGRRPSWKKAYVTLKPGEKQIEFFEGV